MANTNSLKATVIEDLRALTIFEIFNSIDVAPFSAVDAEGKLSEGAEYLDTIRTVIIEAVEYATGDITGEIAREDNYADYALPVYTDDVFNTFISLRAWQEDVDDFLVDHAETGIEGMAKIALWSIGNRLVHVLADTIDEIVENYEAN